VEVVESQTLSPIEFKPLKGLEPTNSRSIGSVNIQTGDLTWTLLRSKYLPFAHQEGARADIVTIVLVLFDALLGQQADLEHDEQVSVEVSDVAVNVATSKVFKPSPYQCAKLT